MASNGSAGNVFSDRRGQNPFQPVKPSQPKVRTQHARPQRPVEDYNGMGASTPNGSAIPRYLNGFQISRQSPDERKRYDTEIRLGLRREKEA